MPDASRGTTGTTTGAGTVLALVFAGALVLAFGMRLPDFVHHDTTEAAMWAHSGWAAGFWKHPPLLPWIIRAWTLVVPMSATSLAILTAVNMTVCAGAVWQIARMAGAPPRDDIAALAVLLLAAVPYASGMAVKLNHNTILISLWPLTILAFLRALDRPTLFRGALFGLACAAAMLAKYYSALLLVACFAASVATRERAWQFYRSPAPYTAVAAFLAAMAPHAVWMIDHQGQSLQYAFHEPEVAPETSKRGPMMALIFAVQAPAILAPMVLAAVLLRHFGRAAASTKCPPPHRFERELLVLTLVPFMLTIAMTAAFHLRGATAWAMPVFLTLPAVIAARLGVLRTGILQRAAYVAIPIIVLLVAGAQFAVRQAVTRGADGLSDPRRAIAERATSLWRAAMTTPLPLVAGDQRLASAAVVFSPDHPQAWPSFNTVHAPWIDPAAATAGGFIALCRVGDTSCIETAEHYGNGRALRCQTATRVDLAGAKGPPFAVVMVLVPPATATTSGAVACGNAGG